MNDKEILEEKIKLLNSIQLNKESIEKKFGDIDDNSEIVDDYLINNSDDNNSQNNTDSEKVIKH